MKTRSHFRKLSSFISPPAIAFAKRWRAGHFSFQKGFTQHHFNIFSLHKLKLEQFFKIIKSGAGFTLIELLIVIAILGVLAAGILVAIDPIDKINQANDSKVQNDVSAMGRAVEAYATLHNGFYPATLNDLVTAGELKRAPVAPGGYSSYVFKPLLCDCITNPDVLCGAITISSQLKSKRYTATPFWRYRSIYGVSAATATETTPCPYP